MLLNVYGKHMQVNDAVGKASIVGIGRHNVSSVIELSGINGCPFLLYWTNVYYRPNVDSKRSKLFGLCF